MSNQDVGEAPPPPGVTPDFHSRPWLLNANRIAVAVGVTVSTLFLIMRIYTKSCVIRKFWWDDVSAPKQRFCVRLSVYYHLNANS
ncbi:hypothetical protein N7466_009392 [Penicillium verhagenii]|uniref:uncharacterized protein n=1 Tax=Penicillium verhagenii TaxID=1562060 RepID=UPI002545A6B9|nr:uncharacterized protein N7466_009392 [Penicillium verhagenii]KAJ5921066.1 hypothetical protein N7466_009392 [Penicillium verhagenii]